MVSIDINITVSVNGVEVIGALNILATISYSVSTFVLAQPGRAIFYICLQ